MKKRFKWKKGLAVLLSACMVLGMVPVQTRAAGAAASGNEKQAESLGSGSDAQTEGSASGDESSDVYELELKDGAYYDEQHVKYTLQADDGTATVAGYDTSYVNDTTFPDDQVEAGNGWEITIPAKVSFGGTEYEVTEIGRYIFLECKQLTKVEFSKDSVITKIDEYTFLGCSIKEITLPESLITIGKGAFRENRLQSIYIPKNVSSIGEDICGYNPQLSEIKVDTENETFNVGLGDVNCIVDSQGRLIQGCSASVIPDKVTSIENFAFSSIDIRNIDFSKLEKNSMGIDDYSFIESVFPEEWEVPECFSSVCFWRSPSLKKVTFHDNNMVLFPIKQPENYGLFYDCSNLQEVVFPSGTSVDSRLYSADYDAFENCKAENLIIYVGEFSDDSVLYQELKAHAYEDHTGNDVVTYGKSETRHYILKKAYRVQFAEDYAGYTLTKAKGCTTLTPIPGDSVRFVINAEDDYKKNVTVYVTDDSGNKTELTKDADGAYTLNNVNENNYKILLENYGECGHESTATYTLDTDESGNSIIIKKCDDCGYEENGKVTATWRHGNKYKDAMLAVSCDNPNIKGVFTITEDVVSGKDNYRYQFTPVAGKCTGYGSVTVTDRSEEEVSKTTNGITYLTVESENDIKTSIGNCSADIHYDSENAVLYINGSETYVVSGMTKKDRIVVNNTKPTTLVLNGLDIQMTSLPAIDLQGTADVKIVLADNTENTLKSTGDYAALQKNDLAANIPNLTIYGPGSLAASAYYGAAIGAEKKKYASKIQFYDAFVTAHSSRGCGIGNGGDTSSDLEGASETDCIINGGSVKATSNYINGIFGGLTVNNGAVVCDFTLRPKDVDGLKKVTKVNEGCVSRADGGKNVYAELKGSATINTLFYADGLIVPEGSTLIVDENQGQMVLNDGKTMQNNGTIIFKGSTNNVLGTIDNNGTIYRHSIGGYSLEDKVVNVGSGIFHEDIDHDGLCDICGEDIGNVTVSYNRDVTVLKGDTLTLSADVTPKKEYADKEITYQWYEADADGNYTKISGATTREYVQKNCSLEVGTTHTYRLQVLCDGIVRYIPFTVTVKKNVEYDGYTLTLGDEIGVNFYMNIPEEARTGNAYMEFSVSGRNGRATETKLSDITAEEDGRYKFTCRVNAIQMAETITAVFHYGENKTVKSTYSVKQYVETILADNKQPEYVKNLVKALADYGYYAQRCLSETRGWTLDQDYAQMLHYSDSPDTSVDLSKYAYLSDGEIPGITDVTKSLSLDSKTAINLFFAFDDRLTQAPSVVVKNAEGNAVDYELTLVNNGRRYRLTIPEIYAHKLGEVYTITVNDTMTIRTSALSYAYAVLQSEQMTDAAKKAVAAMYQYYQAAVSYQKIADYSYSVK